MNLFGNQYSGQHDHNHLYVKMLNTEICDDPTFEM